MMELYENIKYYRKSARMTQTELAERVGYTDRSSIAKIEKGEVDLPQSKIILIASALGVDAGTLMGNTGILTESYSSDETRFLEYYRCLNDVGKRKAMERVQELTEIERYKKETSASSEAMVG